MIQIKKFGKQINFSFTFCQVTFRSIKLVHAVVLKSLGLFIISTDHDRLLLRHEWVSSCLNTTSWLISACQIRREYTFFIGLINHAHLGDNSAVRTDYGTFMTFVHQGVSLSTIITSILFYILLCFWKLVLLSLLNTLLHIFLFLFNDIFCLIQEKLGGQITVSLVNWILLSILWIGTCELVHRISKGLTSLFVLTPNHNIFLCLIHRGSKVILLLRRLHRWQIWSEMLIKVVAILCLRWVLHHLSNYN